MKTSNLPVLDLSVLAEYPVPDERQLDELLAAEIRANPMKIIVLDDDPTGVQTVHDVSVYTDWSAESIRAGFEEPNKVFYILTNSRGMTEVESAAAHRDIAARVAAVSEETGIPYLFMSRSDSTLRGHYPLETEVLRAGIEATGGCVDGEILCPYFKEGGRYTIGNVHYVRQGESLVPAAATEFAKDRTFGYTQSAIPAYIEEKTGAACPVDGVHWDRYPADRVTCISLEDLRAGRIDAIKEQLLAVEGFGKVCLNAIDDCDLKVFSIALYRAIADGKRFLFRTAAGEVKVLGGITDRPLLTRHDMIVRETALGGLVVVGSHTEKTTAQLEELLQLDGTEPVAFDSDKVLEGDAVFYAEVDRCIAEEERIIRSGRTAVCYTARKLLTREDDTKESALVRSVKISDGVQRLVGGLTVTPAFVIAKGGITSSDIGTKALAVKRANVLGQIRPGVPVWQTGEESRFPLTPYVIFPGNVGEVSTLREAVEILTGKGNDSEVEEEETR